MGKSPFTRYVKLTRLPAALSFFLANGLHGVTLGFLVPAHAALGMPFDFYFKTRTSSQTGFTVLLWGSLSLLMLPSECRSTFTSRLGLLLPSIICMCPIHRIPS
ncbi:hypothetical protein C8F04DRAFT_236733 [Mycena alexandri]|uniref:Uncharacterized protein n=1 Tax=Mycena alexandri TaxID=1745969 RepID=A0AAD6SA36_9AGAR|nr:hypothetical protein C8F04DRAFT_236733 [Mycena alexandri]